MGEIYKQYSAMLTYNKALLVEILFEQDWLCFYDFPPLSKHILYFEHSNYILKPNNLEHKYYIIRHIYKDLCLFPKDKIKNKFKFCDTLVKGQYSATKVIISRLGYSDFYEFDLYTRILSEKYERDWGYLNWVALDWEKYVENKIECLD